MRNGLGVIVARYGTVASDPWSDPWLEQLIWEGTRPLEVTELPVDEVPDGMLDEAPTDDA